MNVNAQSYKAYTALFVAMMFSLLSACQKPIPEEVRVEKHHQDELQNVTPDLNLICKKLKNEMKQMSAQRTTFALQQINQDIRLCLPLMPLPEQKQLMQLSDQMYQQFLKIERTSEQQDAFDLYAHDQSQIPTIQQSHFEKLHIRDQYLLRHKGQAYIDLVDTANNKATYQRNAQYLAKVFAPYFPDSEKVFMQTLATQNQQPAFKQQNVLISSQEISQRALFWEDYLKKFPQSSHRRDAQYLLDTYTHLLFLGLKDSPVSLHFDGRLDIQATSLREIEHLAEQKNSRLADQARLFLKFIEMDSSQRHAMNTFSKSDTKPINELQHYLNLKSIDFSKASLRDCFSDAICH